MSKAYHEGIQEPRTEEQLNQILSGFGGLWRYPDVLDYFFLVNPYFPTQEFSKLLSCQAGKLIGHYPSNRRVDSELASKMFGVSPEMIVVGNGTSELIKDIMKQIL